MLDAVLVDAPTEFSFDGEINQEEAQAAWTWMVRDLARRPDRRRRRRRCHPGENVAALDALMPELLQRARKALVDAQVNAEADRRIKSQVGGDEAWARLPVVLNALRNAARCSTRRRASAAPSIP